MSDGWRCPSCGHVYAPSVLTCWNCPGSVTGIVSTLGIDADMGCACPTDTGFRKMHVVGCPFATGNYPSFEPLPLSPDQ